MALRNKFIGHLACPQCGSKDNIMAYDNGYLYCNTPGCGYFRKGTKQDDDSPRNTQSIPHTNFFYRDGATPRFLTTARNFTYEAIKTYRLSIRQYKNIQVLSFPCFQNGFIIGCKNRTVLDNNSKIVWSEKNYFSEGNVSDIGIFGANTLDQNKNELIITEGELDAVAAWIMYGYRFNVVSLLHGANSVTNDIEKSLDIIDRHNSIVICFDNDNAGKLASELALKSFSPGKAKNCLLPKGFKDPCELLKARRETDFRSAIDRAQNVQISGFIDKQKGIDRTIKYLLNIDGTRKFFSTGYKKLDNLCGGFRSGEVFTLVGGTGIGKSSVSFNLTINALKQKKKVLFLPFEMSYEVVNARLLEIYRKEILIKKDNGKLTIPEKHLRDSLIELTETLYVHDHCGGMPSKKLINTIEYYCRIYGIELVVIDHLHAAINAKTSDREVQAIDYLIAEIKRVAVTHNCCVLTVSHQSKSQQDPNDTKTDLSRVRGSAGIGQNSDLVIGVTRNRDDTVIKLTTLKSHRLFGVYGDVYLNYNVQTLNYSEQKASEQIKEPSAYSKDQWDHVPVSVRDEHLSTEQGTNLRTDDTQVLQGIHAGFSATDKNGKTDLHRSEGNSRLNGSQQTSQGTSQQSFYRLEDLITTRKRYLKQEKEIIDLCAMVYTP